MKSYLAASLSLAAAAFCFSAFGDDVTDAIDEATKAYKSGDLSTAASQLDYAASLVRQQKAGTVVSVFPDALDGWTAEDAESNAAAGMFMGGGITASRRYTKGDSSIEISLVMDSPMLQSISMMLSNPAMLTMNGGKLVKVQGNKAALQDEDGRLTLNFIVNNNALFTIEGYDGVTKEEVMQYAEKLKLDEL